MRTFIVAALVAAVAGCAGTAVPQGGGGAPVGGGDPSRCLGNTALPPVLAGRLEPVEDPALLARALGAPGAGKLCLGRAYRVRDGARVRVYRAWNSTNPGSELGQWWAAQPPRGRVAAYRRAYEICYQWSPLDMLTHCALAPGATVVVGTGQSAECSQHLSYTASAAQQIYIADAASVVGDCARFDGEFSWTPAAP